MKDFKEPKTIHIQPKHINIPTNVCDVSKFTFISPDNGRKYGYDSKGTPCISKPIQNPINVSYITPKESSSINYISPYSSFTPQDSSFAPKHNIFSPQTHNIIPLHNINISNIQEVSQNKQEQEAQRIKEANEVYAVQQAKIQQERELVAIANKLQLAKEFEATPVGIVTVKLQQAEEIYAQNVRHLKNIKHNIFYEKNKAMATQQIEKSAKQVEVLKALKYKTEQDASEKLWHEREHARVCAENIKMYEALANRQAKEREEEIVKVAELMKIRSQEDKEFLAEKNTRIDIAKEKLYKIELNPPKHNTLEVEKYSPLIIKTLMQYSRDYDGFNKQIISDTIPIQVLHTLSLKKLTSVDSHVVDLIFDLLRDNHLPSLKTLDLSDNPKSIGKGQIGKLADSFFSGNNNLETLDISCVYPPPTDLRAPFKPGGERLVGDAYAGDYPLGHKLFELYCSVSTCKQPLSITLESAVSYPLNSCDYRFDALHIPYIFISHYMDWMGEPASFKTTSIDMVNHTRQILEKMIEIQNEKNLRHGDYDDFIGYHSEQVPHVIETFTWGITKCLTPKTLNKADFEWVKDSLIKSPHDYHHLARIMQLTQTKLDAFVCVTEVMDDRIITHDMLNYKAEWQDAFPLDHFNNRYSKGGKENITKELIVTGKTNTKTFDSGCKHCEESQFAHFLNVLSILEKNDVTAMNNLNLSNSDMDDCDASILAKLIKQGSLPNLKVLDVSGNQITPTGEGFFAQALESVKVTSISIVLTAKTSFKELVNFFKTGFNYYAKEFHIEQIAMDIESQKYLTNCQKTGVNLAEGFMGGVVKCKHIPNKKIAFFCFINEVLDSIVQPETLNCLIDSHKFFEHEISSLTGASRDQDIHHQECNIF